MFKLFLWHEASAILRKKSTSVGGRTHLFLIHNYRHVLGNRVKYEKRIVTVPSACGIVIMQEKAFSSSSFF